MDKTLEQLDQLLEGDVLTDTLSRMLYATDASPYQQRPVAIVRPCHAQDCASLIKFAAANTLPLIPRAAGTSLAGQCVGEGVIVDINHYMNRVIAVDVKNRCATVEPGVVCNDLNNELRELGLMFAPDPSTSNYCTLGGMMGNNAWGIHSQHYGTTRDNIIKAKVVLGDGSTALFEPLSHATLQQKLRLNNREGIIYRTLYDMINRHHALIQQGFPAPDGLLRNTGYPLDALVHSQPWQATGPLFNLSPFICGSEGTLALTTEIELKLVPIPQQRILLCIHFHRLDEALQSVAQVLAFQPVALEIIDHHILKRTATNVQQQANRFWLEGNPAAVLLVEFHENAIAGAKIPKDAIAALSKQLAAYALTVVESEQIEQVWALRKAGLGMLMGEPDDMKGVTGIEDAAVKVTDLAAYVGAVQQLLLTHDTDCVVYGPAGRGTLHLRPKLNLNLATERQKYRQILDQVCDIIIRFGGSISSKHGDGRLRAFYLQRVLGTEIVTLLQTVKNAFDPQHILNPNTVLNALPPDQNLRFTRKHNTLNFKPFFDWSKDSGLSAAVQKCNGAGVCLQRSGSGTMCPSYRATREEKHGTRGRANIFRQVLESNFSIEAMNDRHIKEVLDLCLACKACKAECPATVDIAQMKAEFLQHYHDRHGTPFRSRLIARFEQWSYYASFFPRFSNALLSSPWLKEILGFHPQRQLPELSPWKFSLWWKKRKPTRRTNKTTELVLILDPFSEYYEPNIAVAAVSVLEALNYRVTVTPCLSLGRMQISQGLLRQAQQKIVAALHILYPFAQAGIPLISLEPSELVVLRDEAKVLFTEVNLKQQIETVSKHVFLFDEFLLNNMQSVTAQHFSSNQIPAKYLVHAHCQQKSLLTLEPTKELLSRIPNASVEAIPSGCCGMAGAFGYEKEHYSTSLKIAELELLPAIRKSCDDTIIVATGTSCRHQIADLLKTQALHPAEVLARVMQL